LRVEGLKTFEIFSVKMATITKRWRIKCGNCENDGHNKRTCPIPKTEKTLKAEEAKSKKRPRPELTREETLRSLRQFMRINEQRIEEYQDELARMSGKVLKKDHVDLSGMPRYDLMYSLDPDVIRAQVEAEMSSSDDSSDSSDSK
jgi:hypothetical protein